jgi:hypothetical protein
MNFRTATLAGQQDGSMLEKQSNFLHKRLAYMERLRMRIEGATYL